MRRSADLAKCDGNTNRSSNRLIARSQTLPFSPASELRRQRSILQSKGPSIVPSCHNPNDHFSADLPHYVAPPPSELGIMDRRDSEPSSHRKLHQVKSVISPRKRAMDMYNTTSCSPSSARTVQNVNPSLREAEQGLKLGLKRSMSFLRDNSSNLSKASGAGKILGSMMKQFNWLKNNSAVIWNNRDFAKRHRSSHCRKPDNNINRPKRQCSQVEQLSLEMV
jgi:hypothetical protein